MTARPRNMLFLCTDEQRADTTGAYGNPRIRTPNLDRLAERSVVFEQAYCAMPVCTPSRATLLTGTYPHTHRALHNDAPLPKTVPTITELLGPLGYTCGYAGKWHLGDELSPQRGSTWWASIEDGYTGDHRAGGFSTYHRWLVAHGHEPPDTAPDGSKVFSRGAAARLPEVHSKPAFLAEQACRFLDEHLTERGREPFALFVNFLEPHMPFFGPWDGLYPADDMELPPTWYGEPDPGMPLRYRLRRAAYAGQNRHVETGGHANDEPGWKALRARYWGLVSLVDKYVGRIVDRLGDLRLAGETVVVFTSDHGDMMGEHRLIGKGVPYEGAVRVPLIVHVPGLAPRRVVTPVSQVDLLPSLLDALGAEPPPHLQGRSLVPVMRSGDGSPGGGEVTIEWSGTRRVEGRRPGSDERERRASAAQQRTIRRGRWKLTVDEYGEHELYDLREDPREARNFLHGDRIEQSTGARDAVDDLWERLQAWQMRTDDALALPEPQPWGR